MNEGWVLLAVVGIVFLAVHYFQRQAQVQAWDELAMRTGLECDRGKFFWKPVRVTGNYHGRALVLDTFQRRSGKSSRTYTRVVLSVKNSSELHLTLFEGGILGKIEEWMGYSDIQVGNGEIDRRYRIRGHPEAEVVRVLGSQNVQQKLLPVTSVKIELGEGNVYSEKYGVIYAEIYGLEQNMGKLMSVFELLSGIAEEVERVVDKS